MAFSEATSEWRSKFAVMKAAIESLDLPLLDIQVDEDVYPFEPSPSTDGGQDVWDFISEDEVDADDLYSSDAADLEPQGDVLSWLDTKCAVIASKNGLSSPVDFRNKLVGILKSGSSEEELQSSLADLIGFDDFDFIVDLLAKRTEIVSAMASQGPSGSGKKLLSKAQREEALRQQDVEHKSQALAPAQSREEHYPHVYKSYHAGNTLSSSGQKYALPVGSERLEFPKYEEYSIPAGRKGTLGPGEKLVKITDLDGICRNTFKGYKTLNRMQSLVYPVAYKTSENLLICAPTGAGKTDAAMLTILNTIGHYATPHPLDDPSASSFSVDSEDFKIVYVAPMKALAAEVTEKLGKRLAWLGVKCREYTGDMHLTKAEILDTQIVVTTPEKWDVVTRKGTGDTQLVQKVRLLIIDEVHMLHDERGAVLESLVARTQRQVESTQSLIRIVGLSATLPNYVDVADFLSVNRHAGLFYFDASFRPVPLEQHFIGVKGKAGSPQSRENLDSVAFEKVKEMLRRDHQVMVFVHSRRDTFFTAKMLAQKAIDEVCTDLLDPTGHPNYEAAMRDVRKSRGKDIRDLVPKGLGVHHAGMARSDRNLMERLFSEGVVKVLCCTATLAWGVNLPAAAVVIKGTQVYSAEHGRFVDLGILDVLQIFGRAGRPQFEDTGIGMICTTHDKLHHYLTAVTEQQPIESKFSAKLVDNLNAEISLGTVTSIAEAVQWIGYSYMFVRMQRSPHSYGIEWSEIRDDTRLVQRRRKLALEAARTLQKSQMIIFNDRTEELRSKDIGRIASQYYILHSTIDIFNAMMKPDATEADILRMISKSGEFNNIQSRDSEANELIFLRNEVCVCEVEGGIDTPQAKTNILLQAYISRAQPNDFALGNDLNYVATQSGRICRALFMLALNRRWGYQCLVLLTLAKSIERRVWPTQHPLHQFELSKSIMNHLDAKSVLTIEAMKEMSPIEIGDFVSNRGAGDKITKLVNSFPLLNVDATIAPLTPDVARVKLTVAANFTWNDNVHGKAESFYIWVEDADTMDIYHHEFFILGRRKLYDEHEFNFTIPLPDPLPPQIYVRAVSDRWIGAESVTAVSFKHLIRPDTASVFTDLLNLRPLPITALKNPALEEIYANRFQFFNPMQTQLFWTLYNRPGNVLLGSPTGSGKTVAAEIAMWRAFREEPGSKVVYIAPMKALVRERVHDWGKRLARPLGLRLVELTGDNTPDTRTIRDANIIITTPEKWDGISRSWKTRDYVRKVSLVIIDEIHLLAGDRGPVLEIIVSRMNYIARTTKSPMRILGMSTACSNAQDLADWLNVSMSGPYLFNFRHSVRPVPLEIFIDGFPETKGFCPLMQSMNRPTFLAIKNHSPEKPVIVFVPSRRQTRLTARDLINLCGMEDNPRRFLHMDEDDLQANLLRVKDDALKEAINFGIGLHHAGLVESDRQLSEELFLNNKIQILVATSTLAWGVNLPAHLVVVKGTQFYDAKTQGYKDMDLTDVLQMLGRAGRPQFDTSAVARIFTQSSKKDFYKHFLHTGFPVESSLHKVLDDHLCAEISAGTIANKQDALDYITCTFFFRRLHKNPSYYGLEVSPDDDEADAHELGNKFLADMVHNSVKELVESGCVELRDGFHVQATPLGRIMSYYYLSHKTMRHLHRQVSSPTAAGNGPPSLHDVLGWVSRATEYDELPVRHNEDLVNAELARALPLPLPPCLSGLPLWDPHVKAFFLLQAHLSRSPLPISDYVGDQTSVLDQVIRITQAAADVAVETSTSSTTMTTKSTSFRSSLAAARAAVLCLQCLKSARWPADAPVRILPGVPDDNDACKDDKTTLAGLVAAAMASSGKQQLDGLAGRLGVPAGQKAAFFRAAASLPSLEVAADSSSSSSSSLAEQGGTSAAASVASAVLEVRIRRKNALTERDARAWTPKWPKPQTEGWIVFVAEGEEVLAKTRVGWSSSSSRNSARGGGGGGGGGLAVGTRPSAKATLKLQPCRRERKVDVLVMSDCYIGMEYKVSGVVVPADTT